MVNEGLIEQPGLEQSSERLTDRAYLEALSREIRTCIQDLERQVLPPGPEPTNEQLLEYLNFQDALDELLEHTEAEDSSFPTHEQFKVHVAEWIEGERQAFMQDSDELRELTAHLDSGGVADIQVSSGVLTWHTDLNDVVQQLRERQKKRRAQLRRLAALAWVLENDSNVSA